MTHQIPFHVWMYTSRNSLSSSPIPTARTTASSAEVEAALAPAMGTRRWRQRWPRPQPRLRARRGRQRRPRPRLRRARGRRRPRPRPRRAQARRRRWPRPWAWPRRMWGRRRGGAPPAMDGEQQRAGRVGGVNSSQYRGGVVLEMREHRLREYRLALRMNTNSQFQTIQTAVFGDTNTNSNSKA